MQDVLSPSCNRYRAYTPLTAPHDPSLLTRLRDPQNSPVFSRELKSINLYSHMPSPTMRPANILMYAFFLMFSVSLRLCFYCLLIFCYIALWLLSIVRTQA